MRNKYLRQMVKWYMPFKIAKKYEELEVNLTNHDSDLRMFILSHNILAYVKTYIFHNCVVIS